LELQLVNKRPIKTNETNVKRILFFEVKFTFFFGLWISECNFYKAFFGRLDLPTGFSPDEKPGAIAFCQGAGSCFGFNFIISTEH
jgi:hypothetical protein